MRHPICNESLKVEGLTFIVPKVKATQYASNCDIYKPVYMCVASKRCCLRVEKEISLLQIYFVIELQKLHDSNYIGIGRPSAKIFFSLLRYLFH